MILLINKATKLSHDFMGLSKQYIADIRFGIETDSMDMDGNIIRSTAASNLDRQKIKKILDNLTGDIEQVPPMFSAIKHRGQPLYRLARKNVEIPRKARKILGNGLVNFCIPTGMYH